LKLEVLLKSKKPTQTQNNPPPNAHKLPHKMGIKKAPPFPLSSPKEKNQVAQIVDFCVCSNEGTIGEHEITWQEGETEKAS